MLSEDSVLLLEVGEIGNGLDGLAESHVVGQDAVGVLSGEVDHPLQRLQLVGFQLPANQQARLRDFEVAAVLIQEMHVCLALDCLLDLLQQLPQLLKALLLP
jgi:hypothetical protein